MPASTASTDRGADNTVNRHQAVGVCFLNRYCMTKIGFPACRELPNDAVRTNARTKARDKYRPNENLDITRISEAHKWCENPTPAVYVVRLGRQSQRSCARSNLFIYARSLAVSVLRVIFFGCLFGAKCEPISTYRQGQVRAATS